MSKASNSVKGKPLRISLIAQFAIIVGITIHLLGFLAFHIQTPSTESVRFSAPYVQYPSSEEKKSNQLLREQSELYDSAPLFLPTSWNYVTNVEVFSLEVDNASLFPAYGEEWTISDEMLKPNIGNGDSTITRARDSLKYEYWDLFSTIGEEKQTENWMSARTGFVEVYDMLNSKIVRSETLRENIDELKELPLWTPLEFLITIDNLGPIGEPMLLKGSGSETIDAILRDYILEPIFGARLLPGYYKVSIGP